jgi:hypothetical protein
MDFILLRSAELTSTGLDRFLFRLADFLVRM